MTTSDFFDANGYVVLSDVLSKEQCAELTQYMFKLHKEGKLHQDTQCPISDAVYGDPVFDGLMVSFADSIGKHVNRKLLPTYTYARIYRPGEVLKKHRDREACEISATLTLGFDAKTSWPIFFDDEKCVPIKLEPGEMAVYKGCDITHWRTAFKGEWHVQLFLHYVDANGPYKNQFKDKRNDFGVDKDSGVPKIERTQGQEKRPVNSLSPEFRYQKPVFNSVIIPSHRQDVPGYMEISKHNYPELRLSSEECNRIIDLVRVNYPTNASVGGTVENSKVNKRVRSADIYVLDNDEENKWIFDKVASIISIANSIHFDYDISGITHGIQLIHYRSDEDVQGHYDWHVDAGPGEPATR